MVSPYSAFTLTAMVRVHRQISADGVPFSPDQALPSLTTQLQVSTTQVHFLILYAFYSVYKKK
jgi:hypothetical protein